jgi:Ca-activated chloride channel family protein
MFVRRMAVLIPVVLAALSVSGQNKHGSAPATVPGEEAQSAIRVDASLVNVPVSVTDSRGQFVSGLPQDSFLVYENGQLQQISLFEDGDVPATVGLVVDHSGSMRAILPEVSAAAVAFAQSSNPKDEMFVVDFNDIVTLAQPGVVPFTSDVRQLEKAVSGVRAEGRTALNDALFVALNQLRSTHRDRQALIVVSDGGDNASKHNFSQVLAAAKNSKATIYAIGIFDANQADKNPGMLEKLVKTTGGRVYFPHSAAEVTTICTQIARDIREEYTLGYSPTSPAGGGAYRKLEVKVHAPNHERLRVRTRAGYVTQPGPTLSSSWTRQQEDKL